jgi:dynein heavy chain
VDGEFVDSETIKVKTPNYEQFGALAVDVRVNISGEGWTVNKCSFSYFANTAARNCIAYGPGLLERAVFGVKLPFNIQVRCSRGSSLASCWGSLIST